MVSLVNTSVKQNKVGAKMKISELLENVDLLEINMSPSGLAGAVKDINALAGMEFELCVPRIDDNTVSDEEAIGQSFKRSIGKRVKVSNYYHSAIRDDTSYIIEPDGSIQVQYRGDMGLEFISPPMPIGEMLSDFDKVVKWAKDVGAYTNQSTGLHMNVSTRGMGTKEDGSGNTLDYVKLAILLGDRYVLEQFERLGNSYAVSAMEKIESLVEKKPEKAAQMLDLMRNHLDHMASLMIHSGTSKKYTSINTKKGYIEFRSPGGDWLSNPKLIEEARNSLLRFVVALDAANDPNKYRQEYLKKLYMLLAPSKDDRLDVFWKYHTGKISKETLIKFLQARKSSESGDNTTQ